MTNSWAPSYLPGHSFPVSLRISKYSLFLWYRVPPGCLPSCSPWGLALPQDSLQQANAHGSHTLVSHLDAPSQPQTCIRNCHLGRHSHSETCQTQQVRSELALLPAPAPASPIAKDVMHIQVAQPENSASLTLTWPRPINHGDLPILLPRQRSDLSPSFHAQFHPFRWGHLSLSGPAVSSPTFHPPSDRQI